VRRVFRRGRSEKVGWRVRAVLYSQYALLAAMVATALALKLLRS